MTSNREYNPVDRLLIHTDQALRTVFGRPHTTERAHPSREQDDTSLTEAEKRVAMRLMRVNHTGEVCAQALYQGQAVTARLSGVQKRMERAAAEENDHLDWCEQRVKELGGRVSVLNPLFYVGSFCIGALAGKIGDRWSLGFVAETERQVVRHLEGHLQRLPQQDARSRAIVEQMKEDEQHHGQQAQAAGGVELPGPVRWFMSITSQIMTRSTYWV